MPFLLAFIKRKARSHLCIGICERSMTEPTRTVNFSRHWEHQYQPGPMDLPPSGATVSTNPQCGQAAPLGHFRHRGSRDGKVRLVGSSGYLLDAEDSPSD